MVKVLRVFATAALAAATAGSGRQDGEPPLTVRAIRFYSPVSATTTIEGVCELRLRAMAAGGGPGAAAAVRYRETVAVFDSAGLQLQSSEFAREMPGAVARTPEATAVETFEFRAAPGTYRLVVRAIPETGETVQSAIDVRAYAGRPGLSDLLLATAARQPASDTAPVEPGEVRRGNLVLRTAPVPHLTPRAASLTYYAEIYPRGGTAADGTLRVAVLGEGGRVVIETPARTIHVAPAGGIADGTVDLAGLPAGEYALRLSVALGDSTVTGRAPFSMGALGAGVEAAAESPRAPAPGDPFATADEVTLDSMYAPLSYLLEEREQGIYPRLSVDGKRRFLEDFWRRRDPSHGTGPNQALVDFYRAVSYANAAFREGGAGQIPGWRTDRGRIYLRYGRWDEILQRPMASPRPYEAWKYTRGRGLYYVFQDQTGFGHYVLIGTNDRREPGFQNWESYLQPQDFQEVARFLGLSLLGEP